MSEFRGLSECPACQRLPTVIATPRSRSIIAGPIPDTRVSSVSVENHPRRRSEIMRCASTGPIPGSSTRADSSARFTSTNGVGLADPLLFPPSVLLGRGALSKFNHGSRRATVTDPIPLTTASSPGFRKTVPVSRASTIARAVDGPIPGKRASSTASARLGSIRSLASSGRFARSAAETARWVATA